IVKEFPKQRPAVKNLLDNEVNEKYILTPNLWDYLYKYAKKHKEKGNGFGFGLVDTSDKSISCRTLSARYLKVRVDKRKRHFVNYSFKCNFL
ncbi:hypothetical protein LKW57_004494, partial [Salmonella enterica]|nr:hypothetical protein [Salmonella enterica]